MQKLILVILFFTIGFQSCKSKKNLTKFPPAAAVVEQNTSSQKVELKKKSDINAKYFAIKNAAFQPEFFSAKASLDYNDTELPLSFLMNVNVKIEKDKRIWLSASVMLLGEMARVMFTPDSIRILDKYNKKYISKDYSYLKKFASVDFNYSFVQNLIWGNVILPESDLKSSTDSSDITSLK